MSNNVKWKKKDVFTASNGLQVRQVAINGAVFYRHNESQDWREVTHYHVGSEVGLAIEDYCLFRKNIWIDPEDDSYTFHWNFETNDFTVITHETGAINRFYLRANLKYSSFEKWHEMMLRNYEEEAPAWHSAKVGQVWRLIVDGKVFLCTRDNLNDFAGTIVDTGVFKVLKTDSPAITDGKRVYEVELKDHPF